MWAVINSLKNNGVTLAFDENDTNTSVELFLTGYGEILLYEVAPSPHNSGHHTIESCYTSQYEQRLRAGVGLPLGDPSMKAPASMRYNILGEDELKLSIYICESKGRWVTSPLFDLQWALWVKSFLKEGSAEDIPGSDSDLPLMKEAAKVLDDFGVSAEMPRGAPVATVAINNATNAGLLAVRILGVSDTALQARMAQFQEDARDTVLEITEKLEKVGWEEYLSS
ncbi:phosphoribosylaminoimidazole carboxylase, chloroplastic [Artemisia annua]|uniref:phosphoribosylaminoimidazole carboxylase n=1 Tax=Artemisia annua TaxID=35608 RepID=A0A2U1PZL3_ARTAN|nr:phosphoribosylaminoimidazole carboxylase, chloroplastic [Artemisia annua]